MTPDAVAARRAIESLRSGVPSRYAVEQLGTTQYEVKIQFQDDLDSLVEGSPVSPLVVAANFGAGKTHLLEYLQSLAERMGCVASYVVVSPEMPLGNSHVVLRAIAESARAPGRTGRALRAVMADFSASSPEYDALRRWVRDTGLQDLFSAVLHLYAEFRADETFRAQLLEEIEGKVMLKNQLKSKLKEIGQSAAYDLGTMPRQPQDA
ncbi:MAG TPA: BREX system ATP-binding domain-containing protein [Chthonomonadaceae bacterium]|nr:BREX system ATP-binding domain-containing protein [Chthonomonadaceae bacterium]